MIGEHIEHYRILQHVGGGGMGTVFRALDTMLEREVALKILRADLSDQPDVTRRFRAEAVTLARLSHPHIATLFGLVRHGPQLCMVMELVPGDTLATLLQRESRLGWEHAARLSAQILSALDYAHRAGIVHRDIKPSNVIVSEAGVVKVLDFGIARVLSADRLTRQGLIIGTPQYMAPEQIRAGEVDGRADVYAVGVLLYEMLAGRLPFRADNDIALMYAHLEGQMLPLGEAAPDTPAWLVGVVTRALARAPDARFQSASAFQDALEVRLPHRTPVAVGRTLSGVDSQSPTIVPETAAAVAVPTVAATPQPVASAGIGGGLSRLRSWMFPRVTWEYQAGPDGLLTVRRALRPRSGAHPQPPAVAPAAGRSSAADAASPRQWAWRVALIAALAAVALAAGSRVWQDERPRETRAAANLPVEAAAAPRAPEPAPSEPAQPAASPAPAPALVAPESQPRRVSRVPEPAFAAQTSESAAAPVPAPPAVSTPTPPVAEPTPSVSATPPAPARFTPPANLKDEVLEDVVLLVPGERGGYDEVDVTLTFERDRLVVFDTDEERVVATVLFDSGDGPSVTGPATWLTGRDYWFIVPTTTGRIVVQLDYRAASRATSAFEARTGRTVRRADGELDR
jgi:eukaryotic-like serine/threonine-protein kinase